MTYDTSALQALVAQAKASGGSEIANPRAFIDRRCAVLDLPCPVSVFEAYGWADLIPGAAAARTDVSNHYFVPG